MDGGYHSNHYSLADPRSIVQNFVTKYKATYFKEPDALAVLAYDATNILLEAIKIAGTTDTDRVRDVLAETQFDGVTGEITFDKEGDPIKTAAIVHITDGRKTFVKFIAP